MTKIDPFALKQIPKWHPKRLAYTAWARVMDRLALARFNQYELPLKVIENCPPLPVDIAWDETQVTPEQMQHLLYALKLTEHLSGSFVVEIGCWRGVTTKVLATHTERPVVGVDCYLGPKNQVNRDRFLEHLKSQSNVKLLEATSGDGARGWQRGPISFLFIDAAHDYWNVAFDLDAWVPLVMPGGIIALHDTDLPDFAGSRMAVHEVHQQFELVAHPKNLTIFRKPVT